MEENEKLERPTTINMLLDPNMFSGRHQGRILPIMITIVLICLPLFAYVMLLFSILPFALFVFPYLYYIMRVVMIIPGEEKKRLKHYRDLLYDVYSPTYELIEIKTIHEDGCIEYVDGIVEYMILSTNASIANPLMKAQIVSRLLTRLSNCLALDIYVQNMVGDDELSKRYDGIRLMNTREAAVNYIEMIDHNRDIIAKKSLITKTAFVVQARKNDRRDLTRMVHAALESEDTKVFKEIKLATKSEAEKFISRDIDAYLDFERLLRLKYKTGNYYESKVIGYDLKDAVKVEEVFENKGFMVHE